MTDTLRNSMTAINKWVYYAFNYNVVEVEIMNYDGTRNTEYLPDCFNAFPIHLRKHLAGKWNAYYEKYGSRAVMNTFYCELDGTNRQLLMEWVLNNYNDEQKLNFKED